MSVDNKEAPMTDREKLDKLISEIETVVPYVTATLSAGKQFPAPDHPDWVEIHGGRCGSSERQLDALLKAAQELK